MGHARVRRLGLALLSTVAFAACRRPDPPRAAVAEAGAWVAGEGGTPAQASATATASAKPASSKAAVELFDAGTSACKLVQGPIQQDYTGAATLVPTDTGVDVISNRGGFPVVVSVPALTGKPAREEASEPPEHTSTVACALAGSSVFCADGSGTIQRTRGGVTSPAAHARPGTRIAAAPLADGHAALAYLDDRQTSEGWVSKAWLVVDEAKPVVLSEDGAGATFVTMARRGADVIGLYVDARMAMTPVHARIISWGGSDATIGKDAVLFVGGTPEHATRAALAVPTSGPTFGLLPIAGETGFGMAAIRIDTEPVDDAPTAWSLYANGLDPSPLAATMDATPIHIARVRPLDARPDSPRALELGRLDAAGAFTELGLVATRGTVSSVAILADKHAGVWLHYTDGAGSWLERRICP